MIGGFLKSCSCLAVLTAAGVMLGGVSARAADLGGNCCADLEERVAELEATTVRKGNRKVSLQLYGQVSQSVVYWDDGGEKNVYVLENDNVKNRLGVRGGAKINSDWSANYNIELQIRSGRSSQANQFPEATTEGVSVSTYNTRSVSLRYAYWGLKSETFGGVTVGRQTDVTIGAASVNLVDADGYAGPVGAGYAIQGFRLRAKGTSGNAGLSVRNWHTGAFGANGATSVSFDYGPAWNGVKYTSPFFLGMSKKSGFIFSAGWGHDDAWGAALRYVEDFGAIRLAAAVAYGEYTGIDRGQCTNLTPGTQANGGRTSTTDCNSIQAGASIMHVPTGLYVSGGWAQWKDNNRAKAAALAGYNVDNTDDAWYVQVGWQARLTSLGHTIFWGQYMEKSQGMILIGNTAYSLPGADAINSLGTNAYMHGIKTEVWGGGITQKIDAAAMALYLGYYNYSTDIKLVDTTNAANGGKANVDDVNIVYGGATIKF